jgi:hypothetical protein
MLRERPHFLLLRAKQKARVCSKHSSFSQSERERKREGEMEKEGERERDVEYGSIIFIFKRNDGSLAPFSYLVFNIFLENFHSLNNLQ